MNDKKRKSLETLLENVMGTGTGDVDMLKGLVAELESYSGERREARCKVGGFDRSKWSCGSRTG